MGVKGKLIGIMEVKCGGHLVHDIFHSKTHHIPNISPRNVNHFEVHEGEPGKTGSVVSWHYNEDGKKMSAKCVIEVEAIDPQYKSITWNIIEGNMMELYNFFTVTISCEHQWTTWTLVYEKKTDDTSEPLAFLGYLLDATKDMEGHLLKK